MIVRRAARLPAPLRGRASPVCSGHCLTADAADPRRQTTLPYLVFSDRSTSFAGGWGWGGQGRIDPGRASADERDAEVKPGCVRAETIPS